MVVDLQTTLGVDHCGTVPRLSRAGDRMRILVYGERHEFPVWEQPGWRRTSAEAQSGDGGCCPRFCFQGRGNGFCGVQTQMRLNQAFYAPLRRLVVGSGKQGGCPSGDLRWKWLPAVIKETQVCLADGKQHVYMFIFRHLRGQAGGRTFRVAATGRWSLDVTVVASRCHGTGPAPRCGNL